MAIYVAKKTKVSANNNNDALAGPTADPNNAGGPGNLGYEIQGAVKIKDGVFIGDELAAQDLEFVVANKVDGIDGDSESAEFYALGLGNVKQIAAAHGRGVSQLLQEALSPLDASFPDMQVVEAPKEEDLGAEAQREKLQSLPIKLAIVGKPNVGTSTLTNRISGEERVVVYDLPGTTRDSVYIPMERDEREYILIDTAGVRKRKKMLFARKAFYKVKCNFAQKILSAENDSHDKI